MATNTAHRRAYMRALMAKRRQQYRDDMEFLGTPVVMGRPPKEKPPWKETKRTERIRRCAYRRAKRFSQQGVQSVDWREFKRAVCESFRSFNSPTDSELQQAYSYCVDELVCLKAKEFSRRGNPLVVRFPKFAGADYYY